MGAAADNGTAVSPTGAAGAGAFTVNPAGCSRPGEPPKNSMSAVTDAAARERFQRGFISDLR
jgi:hypothetical protein